MRPKSNRIAYTVILAMMLSVTTLRAEHAHHRHTTSAPIGMMGDHTHPDGTWMLSYRYGLMEMDGNRNGTTRVGTAEVLEEFRVSPTSMRMEMHMVGVMAALSDRLTLMGMVPYRLAEMDHVTRMGRTFKVSSSGVGDVKLSGLYGIWTDGRHKAHLNLGLSLPTGSIDEEDVTPMGLVALPYPMQLGSGTWDLMPGITLEGGTGSLSWGSQVMGVIRLGRNENEYSLGDAIDWTTWGAYHAVTWLSTSLRVDLKNWGNTDGQDQRLDPTLAPTADPDLRGGSRVDLLAGLSVTGYGRATGHRIAVEAGLPVWQDLDGPQLETDWLLTAGWQYVW